MYKKMLTAVTKGVARISGFFNGISMILIMAMMFFMTTDVILRNIFQSSITGAYEVTEVMLLTMVVFTFAKTQVEKRHIHVDILVGYLPEKVKAALSSFCMICFMVFVCACVYAQFVQTMATMAANKTSTVLRFVLWPFNLITAIGMFVLLLVLITDVLNSLFVLFGRKTQPKENTEEQGVPVQPY